MKKFIPIFGVVMLLVSLGVVAAAATATGPPEKITICHVAGLASDPANYITLELPPQAVFGEAGHFFENGTPQAGHEQDTMGACNPPPPPPVDVCPNLEGNQATVPPGFVLGEDENGRPACVPVTNPPPPPPVDVCPNLEGNQATVPAGYHLVEDANGRATCVQDTVPPPPPPGQQCVPTGAGQDGNIPPGGNTNDNCLPLTVPTPTPPPATPPGTPVAPASTPPSPPAVTPPAATPPEATSTVREPAAKPKPKPAAKPKQPKEPLTGNPKKDKCVETDEPGVLNCQGVTVVQGSY